MVSDTHKEEIEFAKKFLGGNYIGGYPAYKVIERPSNLMKTLKEINGKTEGSIPDLLLIAHDYQNIDPSIDIPEIPYKIMVLWTEAVESSLQGFPHKKEATEALRSTLTWKELYDQELLLQGAFGQKMKINQELYEQFDRKMTEICVKFFIIKGEIIWECTQITR